MITKYNILVLIQILIVYTNYHFLLLFERLLQILNINIITLIK